MKALLLAGAFALGGSAALAQSMSAQDFVTEATAGGLFEVQSSEIALERSQSEDVQGFAEMMVTDHGRANEELAAIATEQGLEVPAEISGPAADHLAAVEAAEGDSFDPTYVEHQIAAHESAIELYSTYAESGDVEPLVAFAEATLPTLQQHLEMAQGLEAQ